MADITVNVTEQIQKVTVNVTNQGDMRKAVYDPANRAEPVAFQSDLAKSNITGLKLTDSPEFANTEITTLKSDADSGVIPVLQATWLGATAKSVLSYLSSIVSKIYTHITATANAHPSTAIPFVVEEITGAKTIQPTDSGKHFYTTAAANFDITLNSGLTHPISIFQKGAGVPRMIAGSGTPTLLGDVKSAGQNKAIAIVPESTTVYEIIGGVA